MNSKTMMLKLQKKIADSSLGPWIIEARTFLAPGKSARYDRETKAVLKKLLRKTSCGVDIGAHRGTILRYIVNSAPDGSHHAFEPVPHYATLLRKRFPRVQIHEIALSDRIDQSDFCHVTDDPGLSGLKRRSFVANSAPTETIRVLVDRLDSVLPADYRPDLIKIDVEGFELSVLRGAQKILTTHRPWLIFETGMSAKECVSDFTPEVLFTLLRDYGFEVSLMRSWLDGAAPLSRTEFSEMVESSQEYNFLAYPDDLA